MKYAFFYLAKLFLWCSFRLGFGLEVTGQEHVPKTGAFIVAANHVSYLDPPVLGVASPRPLRFMARDTLFRYPGFGQLLRALLVMPLRRGESDVHAIREAVKRLKAGECIGLFPEGTRQLTGRLGQAKAGIGLLANLAGVPVVPAHIQGTFAALPPSATWFHPSKIRVAFGPPISYTKAPLEPVAPPGGPAVDAGERRLPRGTHQALADAVTAEWRRLEQLQKA